jgi:hypothetical protein
VRSIVFADRLPDPPVPAEIANGKPRDLMARLMGLLMRYGGEALRADLVRYGWLIEALPGASWDELDSLVTDGGCQ